MLGRRRCCCGDEGDLSCSPCDIPRENLTVEWTNIVTGDGSATMSYGGAGPDSWASECTGGLLYILSCNAGSIYFRVVYFVAGGCPTGTREECSTSAGGLVADTITCSPLSLQYTLTDVSCPILYSSGFTSFTVRT